MAQRLTYVVVLLDKTHFTDMNCWLRLLDDSSRCSSTWKFATSDMIHIVKLNLLHYVCSISIIISVDRYKERVAMFGVIGPFVICNLIIGQRELVEEA